MYTIAVRTVHSSYSKARSALMAVCVAVVHRNKAENDAAWAEVLSPSEWPPAPTVKPSVKP